MCGLDPLFVPPKWKQERSVCFFSSPEPIIIIDISVGAYPARYRQSWRSRWFEQVQEKRNEWDVGRLIASPSNGDPLFFFTTPGQPSYGYLPQVVKLRAEIPPSFDGLLPPPSPTFLTAAGRLCNQQHGRCRSSIKATCRSGGCLTCRFASQQTTLDALGSVRNQKLL